MLPITLIIGPSEPVFGAFRRGFPRFHRLRLGSPSGLPGALAATGAPRAPRGLRQQPRPRRRSSVRSAVLGTGGPARSRRYARSAPTRPRGVAELSQVDRPGHRPFSRGSPAIWRGSRARRAPLDQPQVAGTMLFYRRCCAASVWPPTLIRDNRRSDARIGETRRAPVRIGPS
jgi:hypothetical protein